MFLCEDDLFILFYDATKLIFVFLLFFYLFFRYITSSIILTQIFMGKEIQCSPPENIKPERLTIPAFVNAFLQYFRSVLEQATQLLIETEEDVYE